MKDALLLGVERKRLGYEEYDRRWRRLYGRLSLNNSTKYTDKDCQLLARRLEKYRFELLTFIELENVDATKIHAERTICPAVRMRKIYYGNRSERGALVQDS